MFEEKCGGDCPGACADKECHYLRELPDGRLVAVTCRGKCSGRCVGRLDPAANERRTPPRAAPAHAARRAVVRSRELYFEPGDEDGHDAGDFGISCTTGCFVGHGADEGNAGRGCYGACLGLCAGVATVQEIVPARVQRRPGLGLDDATKNRP
jgi:hypothetical protein